MLQDEFDDISSDLSRLNALSDGVISIAMTLLVFNFKVPELERDAPSEQVYQAVLHQIPALISVIIAFLSIGIWWLAHKRIMRNIARYDRKLAMMNLLYLLIIALIPFSAALMGQFPLHNLFRTLMFALLGSLGAVLSAIWKYAERKEFVREYVTPDLSRFLVARARAIGATFMVTAFAAIWAPHVASFIPMAIPFVVRVIHRAPAIESSSPA